ADGFRSNKKNYVAELSKTYTSLGWSDNPTQTMKDQSKTDLIAYNARADKYNEYLTAAQDQGKSQVEKLAQTAGKEKGINLGQSEGATNGTNVGLAVAKLDSFYRGLLRGKLNGNAKGFVAGLKNKDSFDDGFKEGLGLGKKNAWQEAYEKQFKNAYRESREENLMRSLSDLVTIDNNAAASSMAVDSWVKDEVIIPEQIVSVDIPGLPVCNDATCGENKEITDYEKEEAGKISSTIDEKVLLTLGQLNDYKDAKRNLSDLGVVYTSKVPTAGSVNTDESQLDCSTVYQGLEIFKKACQQAFRDNYFTEYQKGHWAGFEQEYLDAYKNAKTTVITNNKDIQFGQGLNEAEPIVFAESKGRGAQNIRAQGVAQGKAAGFNAVIADFRQTATTLGKSKSQEFFNKNSVVWAQGISLVATAADGFIQGSTFNLSLDLSNFGTKDANGKRITVSLASNSPTIRVANNATTLTTLPAQKKIRLSNVLSAKIGNDALPGSRIPMKITIQYPGDDINATYRQEFEANAEVKVNPSLEVKHVFQDKVQSMNYGGGFWIKNTFSKFPIKVILKGVNAGVPKSYIVKMMVSEGSDLIKVIDSEKDFGRVEKDQEVSKEMTFLFIKEKRKTSVPFKLTIKVFYDQKEIDSQTLELSTI
ncbi:MAG: hypothetical protein WCG27_11210, partial [Pseudomonadota bacterium]